MTVAVKSCSNCGNRAKFFQTAYWKPDDFRICGQCAGEFAAEFDRTGWPEVPVGFRILEGDD